MGAPQRDLGIYIHVPYCVQRCSYCDFYSQTSPFDRAFTAALIRELEGARGPSAALATPLQSRTVSSLYFGGGTPSLLPPADVALLIEAVAEGFTLRQDAEITLEANPASLDLPGLRDLRSAGVHRLSLGVQTLDSATLSLLGRPHTVDDARRAVALAREAGFDNLSLDLLLAIPGQSLAQSRTDVEALMALTPEHVSAYVLTLEQGTALEQRVARGALAAVSDDLAGEMLDQAVAVLGAGGFARYEISNFARPGREARHNRRYWSGLDYLGLGPAAHSHFLLADGSGWRGSNPASLHAYLRRFHEGVEDAFAGLERVDERLVPRAYLLERVYLGLRDLDRGLDLEAACEDAGLAPGERLLDGIEDLQQRDLIERRRERLVLTAAGARLADMVGAQILGL